MNILGIETTCDETGVAVVRDGRKILINRVASQADLHRAYGGVVPELACRAHTETLLPLLESTLRDAELSWGEIGAVAVANQPGLVGALLVGVITAKAIAWVRRLPLIPVNHLHAHVHAAHLALPDIPYPHLSLVVSGGHTMLLVTEGPAVHRVLGRTTDDAAGEAFDKVAAILGLGYPGGPAIDLAARSGSPVAIPFPRARTAKPLDFSFSGIKTAVLYYCKGQNAGRSDPLREQHKTTEDIAASFQEAIVDMLVQRVERAAEATGLEEVVVGGGVACNRRLRERMGDSGRRFAYRCHFPPPEYCTDNAAMIAALGHHLFEAGATAGLDLEVLPTD